MKYSKMLRELFSFRPKTENSSNGPANSNEQTLYSEAPPLPAATELPFRPFAEPILKPRTNEDRSELHYPHVYQNAFQPKQKNERIQLPIFGPTNGAPTSDEYARVFAPNGDSLS